MDSRAPASTLVCGSDPLTGPGGQELGTCVASGGGVNLHLRDLGGGSCGHQMHHLPVTPSCACSSLCPASWDELDSCLVWLPGTYGLTWAGPTLRLTWEQVRAPAAWPGHRGHLESLPGPAQCQSWVGVLAGSTPQRALQLPML